MTDLLSPATYVETPFISVTIAGYTFGVCNRKVQSVIDGNGFSYNGIVQYFPNYTTSLSVKKINGAVNTYTLTLTYVVRSDDDPNFFDKILSRSNRKIVFSYGDFQNPSYINKEESALITRATSSMNLASSAITYIITAVSDSYKASCGSYLFLKRYGKPSDIIIETLYDPQYGLVNVFPGMTDKSKVRASLIFGGDRAVTIDAPPTKLTPLQYINYLMSYMTDSTDVSPTIQSAGKFLMRVQDDTSGEYGGAYFKIEKVSTNISDDNSLNIYEIDVGFPGKDIVLSFSANNDEAYSILLSYSDEIQQSNYTYQIDDDGKLISEYSPLISNSALLSQTTAAQRSWWSNATNFPITATLTLKGLLKPILLMTYLKINVLFFGKKHITSGYYIVTDQLDEVGTSGYKTTLSLTRVSGGLEA